MHDSLLESSQWGFKSEQQCCHKEQARTSFSLMPEVMWHSCEWMINAADITLIACPLSPLKRRKQNYLAVVTF